MYPADAAIANRTELETRASDRGTKNRRKGGRSEKSTERGWNKDENTLTKEATKTPRRHVRRSQLEGD